MKGDIMKRKSLFFKNIKKYLLYGGIEKNEYEQVREEVAAAMSSVLL